MGTLILNFGAVYFGIHSLKDSICNQALKHPKRWHRKHNFNSSLASSKGLYRVDSNASRDSRGIMRGRI